jgi:hypothetical protein
VHEFTNLGWPDTPFGADKRPFPRKVQLIAVTAIHWAYDSADIRVPAATALVYLPVGRSGSRQVTPATLHVGYRVAVISDPGESPDVVGMVDGHLVQARRHATLLGAYQWAHDAAGLEPHTVGDTPGIIAATAALTGQSGAERGTASLVDVSRDLDPVGLLAITCGRHGLDITFGDAGLLAAEEVQASYREVISGKDDGGRAVQALGLSALCQGLVTALLVGAAAGRCNWESPFRTAEVLGNLAWDAFPAVLPGHAPVGAADG